eukprot:10646343-Alexandrium_andersonii.AAC.1
MQKVARRLHARTLCALVLGASFHPAKEQAALAGVVPLLQAGPAAHPCCHRGLTSSLASSSVTASCHRHEPLLLVACAA